MDQIRLVWWRCFHRCLASGCTGYDTGFLNPFPGETFLEQVQSPRQALNFKIVLPIACMSLVIDVFILILPIAAVSKLQLSLSRKLGIMATFLTGIMSVEPPSPSIALYRTERHLGHVSHHRSAYTTNGGSNAMLPI